MTVSPADYPAPFNAGEFIARPTDPEDERIEVGILIVGAGPAGLAAAIRIGQLIEERPDLAERLGEVPVAVLEKGKQPGSHEVSGAVVNPRGLRRLFRGEKRIEDMPVYGEVEAAYQRDPLLVPRAELMVRWARHLRGDGAAIIPMLRA